MDETAYWELHRRGVDAMERASLPEAARHFAAAGDVARRSGSPALVDRAFCNLAAVRYHERPATALRDGLSRILGASPDAKARQLAAYNLAVLYGREPRLRAATLYAETALRLARSLKDLPAQAASLDLLGLLRVRAGRTGAAIDLFERSLEAGGEGDPVRRALTLSTLAYCTSLAGRRPEALGRLEEGLEIVDRHPSPLYETPVRLNAGYTLLEAGEPETALANGRRALELGAGERGERSHEEGKYALYLIGEALAQQGDHREAKEQFVQLQRRYYPHFPDLSELLLSCRTHVFLNWLT